MSKFILAGVAVALTVFIFFAYQTRAERPGQPQQSWWPSVVMPENKPVQPIRVMTTPRTYKEALDLSRETGKQIVLYFTAPGWCNPCKAMENGEGHTPATLRDRRVKAVLVPYIFYKVDVDGVERPVAKMWGVKSVLTYVVTDCSQKVYKVGYGYRSPEKFVEWLNAPTQISCDLHLYRAPIHPVWTALCGTVRGIEWMACHATHWPVHTERTVIRYREHYCSE